jgi:hypothetical protein
MAEIRATKRTRVQGKKTIPSLVQTGSTLRNMCKSSALIACCFLSYADRMSFLSACPMFVHTNPRLLPSIKTIISSKLAVFGMDPEWFFGLIAKHKAIVTGSFLLWCITSDDFWKPRDIDILIPDLELTSFRYSVRTFFGKDPPYISFYKRTQSEHGGCLPARSSVFDLQEFGIDIFWNRIHVNHCSEYTSMTYISNLFDTDFCKLAFDGTKLMVRNWQSVWTRSSCVHLEAYLVLHRPFLRGDAGDEYLIQKLKDRAGKYASRNFSITFYK